MRLARLLPRPRPPPSTRRRALTSTKERSKASREDDQRLYHRAKMDGALNDEPKKVSMLDAVLGAAVALFFGGGTYAIFLRAGGQLSIPADPGRPERRVGREAIHQSQKQQLQRMAEEVYRRRAGKDGG